MVTEKKVVKWLLLTIASLILLLILNFTWREDTPWWGLVGNPAKEQAIGATWGSIMSEFGENGSKLDEFYRINKRTPRTFKEFDTLSQGDFHFDKMGTEVAKKSAILYRNGYDSDHYTTIYQDGSSCQFYLIQGGFIQACTRRDYWAGGRLILTEPLVATKYK